MEFDTDKIDDAILAFLSFTLHDKIRAWKGHDWSVLGRWHDKLWIADTGGKVRSVVFAEEGLAESQRRLGRSFGRPSR